MIAANASMGIGWSFPDGRPFTTLTHASWVGCHLADLVFPLFLFIMGVSISLSARRGEPIPWPRVLRRSFLLVLLGLAVNAFSLLGGGEGAVLRADGTLQRIGVVYLLTTPLYLRTPWTTRLGISAAILVAYAAALEWIPLPGAGTSDLWRMNVNFSAWLDLQLFGEAALRPGPDGIARALPDSILSVPATAVITLLGTIAGDWIRSHRDQPRRLIIGLLCSGAIGVMLGGAWGVVHPIVKLLWTGSYVLITTGLSLLLVAAAYALIDRIGFGWPPTGALAAFGRNAIVAYLVHVLAIAVMAVTMRGVYVALQPTLSPELASLVVVGLPIGLTYLPIWLLERRGLSIRL